MCLSVWIFTCKYSWLLNSMDLNCAGLLICRYFSININHILPGLWLVESTDMCMLSCVSVSDSVWTLWTTVHQVFLSWNSPGKDTKVSCCVRLWGYSGPGNQTHLLGLQHCQAGLPLVAPGKPHRYGGPTIKYNTRIFYYIGVGTPNLCLVQGSTVYTYASVHMLYYKQKPK